MKPNLASRLQRALCASALLPGLAQFAHASYTSYPELLLDNIKHVITSPSRWEKPEWQNFGLATLAIAGTAAVVDRPLRDEMRRQSGTSTFMRNVEHFGAEYSLGVLGGFYLAGAVGNKRQGNRRCTRQLGRKSHRQRHGHPGTKIRHRPQPSARNP